MDLKSMDRKELQALCKKHGIPANTKNSQMIESLSSILQEKVKPKGCLKGSGGSSAEDLGVFRGGSKKVTFVIEDGQEDGVEEFVVNPVGKSKRKSVGRRSGVASELKNGSGSDSPNNAIEVSQRNTRSRGLAEAVLWSPVIEKKKLKKSGDGTEGARQNAKEKEGIYVALPTTRSLRNRVVTVGGDEKVVTDQNPRRTWKTKESVKEEENEKVAVLEEDEAVGRRNLRKRYRDAGSVEDEPPCRRSTRSHVKPEEAEAVEVVDVERPRKRRKGGLEVSVVEKVVDEETERVSKAGGNTRRLRGNASGDANDSEAVDTSTRRPTRSSSALLEDGNFAFAVGKSDRKGDAVKKGKSQKQAKARSSKGGDLVNMLTDSEVIAEPVKRSTRSSSTLPEDGTSLPAVVKSGNRGVAVKKGKSLKQARDNNSSKGGNTTTSLPDREAIVMPLRRSTRSSSLMENGTSIQVVGNSVEEGEVVATPTRRSTHSFSKLLEDEKPNEAVTSPASKSTRSSSKLLEVEMTNNEAVTSPTGRLARSSSKLLENEMPNYEPVNSPTKRSARSSSKLLEVNMPKNEAVTSHTKRATHSSSKLFEEEMPSNEAVSTPTRRLTRISSKQGDSAAPLQYSEAVTQAKRLTRSSSVLVADEIPNKDGVTASTGRSTHSSLKLLEDETLDNGSIATPTRKSTRSSSKMSAVETSLPVACKLDVQSDAARNDGSRKQPKGHTSKQVDSTASSLNNDAAITPTRRSTCSSSKLFEDMAPTSKTAAQTEALEVYEHELPRRSTRSASKHDESCVSAASLNVSDEIFGTKKKKKRTREVASKEDAFVVERETIRGSGSRGTLQVSSTGSRRKSLRKFTADCEVVQRQCSPHSSSSLSEDDTNVSEMHQSPVNVQLQMDENGTSLVGGTLKDLEDVCFGSHIREKHSPSWEMENTGRDLLSLNLIEDSLDIQENVSGEPMCSNIDVTVEAEGPLELYGDVISKVSAPVELTSPTAKASSGGTSVGALDDVVGITGMESQNITPTPLPLISSEELSATFHTETSTAAQLKEPDSAVEVVEREDMVTGYEEARASSPQFLCKSSAELSLTSDTEASEGFHLEWPNSQAEIHDSTEDAFEGNEATDIREPTFVCKSAEFLSPSFNFEDAPVTDLKEPDPNVEFEGPNEDVSTDSGATKIIDPRTSNTEVCPNAFCDINAEEFDAKVEVHITSKGGVEGTDDKNTTGSPLSFKSTGVLSPSLLNEVSADIDLGESALKVGDHDMNKVASHSNDFLDEASDNHSKTLKVSMTADWDALYLSDIQRMFDNETENCTMDQDSTLNAQLAPGECDVGKTVESPPGNSDSLSCEVGLEVVKETWVSSTLSVTVNECIGTEEDKNDGEMNGDEGRPSSSSENPAFDVCAGDLMKEHGTQSSEESEEIVDQATALCSHGNAKQSDFTQSLCDEDLAAVDGNLRDLFVDKRCEDNNDHFLSPVTFVKPEDNKASHYKIGVVSSEIREENWNVEHGSSMQSLASGSKSVKQLEKEDRLHDDDLKSTRFYASVNDNISPISLGYEGSTKQVGNQDFQSVPESEDSRHLSDQQEVMVNVTESLDVDSADRSPKSTPKAHDSVKPLNVVADILSETADTANEHTDMEFKRSHERGAIVAGETENIEFLESDVSIEGGNDTVMKKADSVGRDKFDHGEVGRQQDEAYLLQETKALSGEHHTDDIASHPSVENSASIPEETLLSLENFDLLAHRENDSEDSRHLSDQQEVTVNVTESLDVDSADRSPKSTLRAHDSVKPLNVVADILSETADTACEQTDMEFERSHEQGAVVAEETENIEFLQSDASIEGGDNTVMKKTDSIGRDKFDHIEVGRQHDEAYLLQEISVEHHTVDVASHLSGENSVSMPEETLLSLDNFDSLAHRENESNDEIEIGAKRESRLPCNIHEGSIAALGESNEEERAHVSPTKPESTPEATMIGEQHTAPSTSETTPSDALNCKEAGLCKESSFGGANSVDMRDEDNDMKGVYITNNDNVELKESSDLNTIIASSKTAEGERGVDRCINMSCRMTHDSVDTGISENNEASPAADSSPKFHTQDEESNRYQGKFESFGQASSVEATWAAPGGTLMFVEELFHTDDKVANSVNDSAPVGQLGHHGENLAHGKCGNFSEEAVATQESEMKIIAASESSVVKIEEAGPYECGMSSEIFSGDFAKPCAGMDSQATHSDEQSESQDGRKIFSQETSEVSKDNMFALLDGGKIEGSAILESKFEESEITPLPRVAKQELIAKNFTELSVTNVADRVLWDCKESMESRSVGNELEDSRFKETVIAQHALDAGVARDSSTATQEESVVSKDDIMAPEEYFEDFGWSFADTFDVGSSHQEVQAVDSQLPMESRIGNAADHSLKSGIDVNQEQSNSGELDQIEESKEFVQSTPTQLVGNYKPFSVIDDAIKNKENAVGLKMDSTRKHNDTSTISNSTSRRPLQSVRRDKDEH